MIETGFDALFVAVLAVFVLATPVYVVRDHRQFEREMREGRPGTLARSLAKGIALQWGTAALLFVFWWFSSFEAQLLYLVPGWSGREWTAVGAGVVLCALAIGQTVAHRGRTSALARIRDLAGDLLLMVPRSPREWRLLDALAFTAGVCEEFVYRGLLLGLLALAIGTWPAVVIASLLFGLAHAYQGVAGGVRTGLFGLVAALLTVFSGSIYVAMAFHVILDLSQMRLFAMAADLPDHEVDASRAAG